MLPPLARVSHEWSHVAQTISTGVRPIAARTAADGSPGPSHCWSTATLR